MNMNKTSRLLLREGMCHMGNFRLWLLSDHDVHHAAVLTFAVTSRSTSVMNQSCGIRFVERVVRNSKFYRIDSTLWKSRSGH